LLLCCCTGESLTEEIENGEGDRVLRSSGCEA